MSKRVIGTAGHIDHGKTSLVRMLTGVDLDTTPEEQERGITIALGFTPSEWKGERIAWVDVPGHERLVRTMIAGATGLDGAVLVVSAVEGVMPQTREHLAILELVGVRHGVVALTMADLVDEELLELAEADVEDLVEGTFLEGAPVIATSAVNGMGKEALLDAVIALPSRDRGGEGPFRLPLDRAFVRPGFGTVATGTAASGSLRDGTSVTLLPSGLQARVRGLQVHGEAREEVFAGERVAVNLSGIERADVGRGEVVVDGQVPCVHVIDVLYTHLKGADAIPDGAQVRMLVGTSEALGRLHVAADVEEIEPGTWPAQIRLDQPLPVLPGDRFVIRRPSPVTTLGGGQIVDPWARRMRKRDRERVADEIRRLAAGERIVWLERAGARGLTEAEWAERHGEGGLVVGGRVLAPAVVERLETALLDELDRFHASHRLALGANRRELHRGALGHVDQKVFDHLVERSQHIEVFGPLIKRTGFAVEPTASDLTLQGKLLDAVREAGLAGMAPAVIHERFVQPEVEPLLRLAEADGRVQQVAGIGWIATDAIDDLKHKLVDWFQANDMLSPGEFKDLTGLTRKAAIPLLEWCDKHRYTQFHEAGKRARGSQLG